MKRGILLVIICTMCFILGACTVIEKSDFLLTYVPETKECIVKNISNENYNDLKITLSLQNSSGFEKELNFDVGNLRKGETYIYQIDEENIDLNTISSINIKSYAYYENKIGEVLIGLLLIILLLFVVIMS